MCIGQWKPLGFQLNVDGGNIARSSTADECVMNICLRCTVGGAPHDQLTRNRV